MADLTGLAASTNINGSVLLPATDNTILHTFGTISLYNESLLLITNGLLQHALVFGLLFLLRNFSPSRVLDLHYLVTIFGLTIALAPIVFLVDYKIDGLKLFFFLEHEAVEGVIFVRVFFAGLVARFPGAIVFACWSILAVITIAVSMNQFYGHGADIVAWGAFITDLLVGISGIELIRRWFMRTGKTSITGRRKHIAEALAGIGFILHGFATMSVGPVLTRILYHDANPNAFANAWVAVFAAGFFAVGLSVPCTVVLFSTIHWCCWHDRKVLPGQADWDDDESESLIGNGREHKRESRFETERLA